MIIFGQQDGTAGSARDPLVFTVHDIILFFAGSAEALPDAVLEPDYLRILLLYRICSRQGPAPSGESLELSRGGFCLWGRPVSTFYH